MLFLMLEIVLDQLAKINQRLSGDQFVRKSVIKRWQNLFFYFAQCHRVTCLFSGHFLDWKITRKSDGDLAHFVTLLPDNLLAECWKKIPGRQMKPKFIAAMQVLARLRRDFA